MVAKCCAYRHDAVLVCLLISHMLAFGAMLLSYISHIDCQMPLLLMLPNLSMLRLSPSKRYADRSTLARTHGEAAPTEMSAGPIVPPWGLMDTRPGVTAINAGDMLRPCGWTLMPIGDTEIKTCMRAEIQVGP